MRALELELANAASATPWSAWGGLLAGIVAVIGASVWISRYLLVVTSTRVPHGRLRRSLHALAVLVLALAVTLIEVALIVSLMLAGGPETTGLARDTVFAAIMIILNGIVGICLLLGAGRHREQTFGLLGVSASLATLAAIAILTLVLPNYTSSAAGPYYNSSQLIFIAVISLVLYGTFVLVQTVRHRDYFLPKEAVGDEEVHAAPPTPTVAWV
ncbi:MAG: ionic transporter y4hA, partial [Janthinobacterium sp.]